jgi:hypothetical protein
VLDCAKALAGHVAGQIAANVASAATSKAQRRGVSSGVMALRHAGATSPLLLDLASADPDEPKAARRQSRLLLDNRAGPESVTAQLRDHALTDINDP